MISSQSRDFDLIFKYVTISHSDTPELLDSTQNWQEKSIRSSRNLDTYIPY